MFIILNFKYNIEEHTHTQNKINYPHINSIISKLEKENEEKRKRKTSSAELIFLRQDTMV